jgi:hypothetical protein
MAGLTLIGKRLKVDFFTIVSDSQRVRFSTWAILLEYYLFTSSELSACSPGGCLVSLSCCSTITQLSSSSYRFGFLSPHRRSPPAKRALHAFFSVAAVLSVPAPRLKCHGRYQKIVHIAPSHVGRDCPDWKRSLIPA